MPNDLPTRGRRSLEETRKRELVMRAGKRCLAAAAYARRWRQTEKA